MTEKNLENKVKFLEKMLWHEREKTLNLIILLANKGLLKTDEVSNFMNDNEKINQFLAESEK